ncbi:MAG: AbiH family protein [Bacteroidota bacterium]
MNRLLIIGNGFDISHGLESRFKDFIEDYFRNAIHTFIEQNSYSDELFEIGFKHSGYGFDKRTKPPEKNGILDKVSGYKSDSSYKVVFHSLLLSRIFDTACSLNWVDIEIIFFQVLNATKHGYENSDQKGAIEKVNSQLEFLKNKLITYLIGQESNNQSKNAEKSAILKCFTEKIKKKEIVTKRLVLDTTPDNLYFLNFNYTNVLENYIKACSNEIPTEVNYIHGDLTRKHGDPIFGFGDELDKKYLEFENEKNYNSLVKHIKSFEYLKTKNFYNLTRFVESSEFQVHIYGHSCGISDRTLLNQIFEHENCKSIKVFYYRQENGENDFVEKSYEIARHFRNKTIFRKKLVPMEMSTPMPQIIRDQKIKV